jgi:molybdate transport system permease protein
MPSLSPFLISLETSAAATAITFVLGLAAARFMSAYRGRLRGLLDGILILPLVLPPTVVGYFLLLVFGRRGIVGHALETIGITLAFSWPATVIAATAVAFPLMYRTALGAFEQVNPNLLGAARTLGAGEWRTLRHVWIPLAWPGILAGTVLSFARALGEFGATLMLAGNIPGRTQTMPLAIFFAAEAGEPGRALSWVLATMAMSLGAIVLLNRRPRISSRAPLASESDAIALPTPPASLRRPSELHVDICRRHPAFQLSVRFATGAGTLGLLGASGSGKSMTLRAIAGLERPDEGRIVLNGRVLFDSTAGTSLAPAARRVGIVFQDYALFPHLTARQNIAFGLHGRPEDEARTQVASMAKLTQLEPLLDRYPGQLSGGQRQRVALARALAMQPEALLLDEPFAALDPHLRRQMEEQLRAILRGYDGATILVTHDRNEAFRLCEELVVLAGGKVAASGGRHELFESPRTVEAARVTGCKNLAALRPLPDGRIEVPAWGCALRVARPIPAAPAYAGIRAHHIAFPKQSGVENSYPCWLVETVESPFEMTIYLRLNSPGAMPHLEAEIPIDAWPALAARPQPWIAHLPPERLLLVSEADGSGG